MYFFYDLPRFSVDCDFDLLEQQSSSQLQQLKLDILAHLQTSLPRLTIKIDGTSDYSLRYIAQYGGSKTIKIEISPKVFDNQYEMKSLQGVSVMVMKKEWMFAHKLCALVSRYQQREVIAIRDLFDIRFFFDASILPQSNILIHRYSNMIGHEVSLKECFAYIFDFLKTHENYIQKHILDGLGELVDEPMKQEIRRNLL